MTNNETSRLTREQNAVIAAEKHSGRAACLPCFLAGVVSAYAAAFVAFFIVAPLLEIVTRFGTWI